MYLGTVKLTGDYFKSYQLKRNIKEYFVYFSEMAESEAGVAGGKGLVAMERERERG